MHTSAIAATIHGSEEEAGVGTAVGATPEGAFTPAPTGLAQRWQKRAPGESDASQPAHFVVSRDAPQFAQNRPVPGVPHAGQTTSVVDGCVMRYNLNRTPVPRRTSGSGNFTKNALF